MSYTEELLTKADEVIPRVTFEDFKNDLNEKIMKITINADQKFIK